MLEIFRFAIDNLVERAEEGLNLPVGIRIFPDDSELFVPLLCLGLFVFSDELLIDLEIFQAVETRIVEGSFRLT